MADIDKNQAMINYLSTCTSILNSNLYFNYSQVHDDSKLMFPITGNEFTQKRYVDGTILKTYSMTLVDYKSTSDTEVVFANGYTNENIEDMLDMQGVIDWIKEQNDLRNFPLFGEDYPVESIKTTSEIPNLDGFYTDSVPPIARYSITIQVDYIDTTGNIWN